MMILSDSSLSCSTTKKLVGVGVVLLERFLAYFSLINLDFKIDALVGQVKSTEYLRPGFKMLEIF